MVYIGIRVNTEKPGQLEKIMAEKDTVSEYEFLGASFVATFWQHCL